MAYNQASPWLQNLFSCTNFHERCSWPFLPPPLSQLRGMVKVKLVPVALVCAAQAHLESPFRKPKPGRRVCVPRFLSRVRARSGCRPGAAGAPLNARDRMESCACAAYAWAMLLCGALTCDLNNLLRSGTPSACWRADPPSQLESLHRRQVLSLRPCEVSTLASTGWQRSGTARSRHGHAAAVLAQATCAPRTVLWLESGLHAGPARWLVLEQGCARAQPCSSTGLLELSN